MSYAATLDQIAQDRESEFQEFIQQHTSPTQPCVVSEQDFTSRAYSDEDGRRRSKAVALTRVFYFQDGERWRKEYFEDHNGQRGPVNRSELESPATEQERQTNKVKYYRLAIAECEAGLSQLATMHERSRRSQHLYVGTPTPLDTGFAWKPIYGPVPQSESGRQAALEARIAQLKARLGRVEERLSQQLAAVA
jgi:hypothetical protein